MPGAARALPTKPTPTHSPQKISPHKEIHRHDKRQGDVDVTEYGFDRFHYSVMLPLSPGLKPTLLNK